MPITDPEWESITKLAEAVARKVAGSRADFFVTGKVLKVDAPNKCIYMAEFGDQPIPVVGFDHQVVYYDETPKGTTSVAAGNAQPSRVTRKVAEVTVIMPKVGQSVLVAREMGTRRLPRCLGVIQGKKWIVPEEE